MQDASTPFILLLTEKTGTSRLARDFGFVAPCRVMTPHAFSAAAVYPRLIVTDIEMTDLAAIARLRQALQNHKDSPAPILCLVSEMSQQAVTRARALGARELLLLSTPREALLDRVSKLLAFNSNGRNSVVQRGVISAGLALSAMMEAAASSEGNVSKYVEAGTASVLATIEKSNIQVWLETVWKHDDATHQHCLLVAGLAAALSVELGFHAADRRRLTRAAVLHDIGKARIPLEILNKPEGLTQEELVVMRGHAAVGHEILMSEGGFDPEVLSVVRHHHEFLDGSGYPDGLKGKEIPDLVRLTTICDIYAALVENRSYKPPMPPMKAWEVLDGMGSKLDPHLVKAFRRVVLAGGAEKQRPTPQPAEPARAPAMAAAR